MVAVKGAPVGMGSIAPSLWHLSGGYRFRGLDDWSPGHPRYRDIPAIEDETEPEEPGEIVAELHAEMAMKSPGLAALVAEHDRLRAAGLLDWLRPPSRQQGGGGIAAYNARRQAARDERMRDYAELRASGRTKRQACQRMGISERMGSEFEADMHLVTGGGS